MVLTVRMLQPRLGRHPLGDLGRGQRSILPEHLHDFMLGAGNAIGHGSPPVP